MATTTTKLGLKKPTAADYFNIDDINGNMDKIDALTHIVATGSTEATRYAINSDTTTNGNVTWRWKKYNNGTFTACTFTTLSNLRCNEDYNQDGTWVSGYVIMKFPSIGISSIFNVQTNVRMQGRSNWAIDCSTADNITAVTVRLVGLLNEGNTEQKQKRIFIQIDGTWK